MPFICLSKDVIKTNLLIKSSSCKFLHVTFVSTNSGDRLSTFPQIHNILKNNGTNVSMKRTIRHNFCSSESLRCENDKAPSKRSEPWFNGALLTRLFSHITTENCINDPVGGPEYAQRFAVLQQIGRCIFFFFFR